MKIKNNFMIYLLKKQIIFFWNFIDNIAYKFKIISKLYDKFVGKIYENEYKSLNILNCDKVLHIGCGAYPLTEIIFSRISNANIVGIDRNPNAVKLANDVIFQNDLQRRVKINIGNGINYPIEEFNFIIISGCTLPMVEVLDYIFSNIRSNTKIIIRDLDVVIKPIINLIDSQDNITLIKKIESHSFPFYKPFGWQSLYVLKSN